MNTAMTIQKPSNEPVFSYAPGTPEREALKAQLERMLGEEIEIPLVKRSEEPLEAKRRQAEAGNPVPTPGKDMCAARPTPSTGLKNYPWPKALSSVTEGRMPRSPMKICP